MNKTVIAVATAALLGLLVFEGVQCSKAGGDKDETRAKVSANKVVADCFQDGPACLPAIEMKDDAGVVWTRESLIGKVVVINFWATWCRPCQSEIPDLAKVARKYKEKDVVILGLMTDQPSPAQLESFSKRYGLDYPVVRVNREISAAFGYPNALPTNFVYSRGGKLMFDSPGAVTAGSLEREIKSLL